jgi:hypothetical protein
MRAFIVAMSLVLGSAALGAEGRPPSFSKKPSATKRGERVRIDFAVDRMTDVAVFIEDAKGNIVRHLVAGRLGKNPPPPLKANSLSQSIAWDGTADYGRSAGKGPFKVRVALGVGARFDKVLLSDYKSVGGGVNAIGVGPDGTLYAQCATGATGIFNWGGTQLLAFDRKGEYKRMIAPYASNLKKERVKAFDVFDLDGRPAPLVNNVERIALYPTTKGPRRSNIAVSRDGKLYRLTGAARKATPLSIAVVDAEGGCPEKTYAGAKLLPGEARAGFNGRSFIALSSDEKYAFVTGLLQNVYVKGSDFAAVYRVKLPERSPAKAFFGDPGKTGKDKTHLGGAPRGIATDGQGHLLVADHANDRVVVISEETGKYVSEFAVNDPHCVAVDPKTRHIYMVLASGDATYKYQLVKYSGWKQPRQLAGVSLRFTGNRRFPPTIALDSGAKRPLIWICDGTGLLQTEDLGERFGDVRRTTNRKLGDSAFLDVVVDRRRNEVYFRDAYKYLGGRITWRRYEEARDTFSSVSLGPFQVGSGAQLGIAPQGHYYAPAYPLHLLKFDRGGKPSAWTKPNPAPKGAAAHYAKRKKYAANTLYAPVSMTHTTHTLGVRHDGHIFMMVPESGGGRPPKKLVEFLPSGKRVSADPVIWKLSDGAIGPKFDAQGNIYIAEIVRPLDQPYPPELEKAVGKMALKTTRPGKDSVQDNVANMYGSILKFTPKGGMVCYANARGSLSNGGQNPFKGKAKLAPGLKVLQASYYSSRRLRSVKIVGAEWMAPGYSHVEDRYCNCETTRFDVDGFGRVWYPDLNLFRVRVIDTNGNPLMHFGGYGNAESCGPDSKVLDPKTGELRPRRPDDPKELKSPFAEPEIAFAWLNGVGVTDKYAYTGDEVNRRMLKIKIVYAAEATCDVK